MSTSFPVTLSFHIDTEKDVGNPVRVIVEGDGIFLRGNLANAMIVLADQHEVAIQDLTLNMVNPTEPDDYIGMTEFRNTGVWI